MYCDSLKLNVIRHDSLVPPHYDRGSSGGGGERSDDFDGNQSWQPCRSPRRRVNAWRRQRHAVVSERANNVYNIIINVVHRKHEKSVGLSGPLKSENRQYRLTTFCRPFSAYANMTGEWSGRVENASYDGIQKRRWKWAVRPIRLLLNTTTDARPDDTRRTRLPRVN